MELSGWSRSSRGVPAQSTAVAGTYRVRMGSRGRGSTERQGSGTRSRTGRFVPAGSGSNPPEHAHSLHSTTQGAHRSGSRLRTIPRRSVIGRPGKIKAIEELVSHSVSVRKHFESFESFVIQSGDLIRKGHHRCGRRRTADVTTAANCDI